MSEIRKQSIISSIVVYFGFALGFFNTYLFTKEGGFTKEQYGLTAAFIAIANIMLAVANLGMPSFINKFFPYYRARLTREKNDMLTMALVISTMGFSVVLLFGYAFRHFIFERFSNSPGVQQYYTWMFPFGFGLTLFSILEAYAWQHRKSTVTNFLKEVFLRLLTTVLIILTTYGIIESFSIFIKFYSFLYIAIALMLLTYLLMLKKVNFVFTISEVTKKFSEKIIALCSFVWTGGLIYNVANVFDTIVLAAVLPEGLAVAGIFTLAQNISSLIQAPQRGIVAASIGPLSQAWKEKDLEKIDKIYHRSSINQLIFSLAMFSLIWLNFDNGVETFNLQQGYLDAKIVFLFIGLTRIIDMGTGVNAQIIATSTFWRFEFVSGLVLLALALPLNYFLTVKYGLLGPAMSNLVSFTVYNFVRYFFLYKKFGMQPFTIKSLHALIIAAICFFLCYFLFDNLSGLLAISIRSVVFLVLYVGATLLTNVSPDIKPVFNTLMGKLQFRK